MTDAVRSIRVLAVDDDPMVLDFIQTMLKVSPDLELVAAATDGDEAVSAVIAHRPDVVLMDIQMRRVNGIDATRTICSRPEAPKVVMLTTFDDASFVPQAMEAGAVGYTLKTTAKDELFNTIRAAYRGSSPMSPESAGHLRASYLDGGGAERLAAQAKLRTLSQREIQVAELIAMDLTNEEIAARLHLSVSSIKTHIKSAQEKLGAKSRVGIATTVVLAR